MMSVVEEIYCNPYTTELVVKRRRISLQKDVFEVFDLSGNLIFTVDGGLWNIRRDRVLRDPNGLPLLSMRTKGLISLRYKWEVYKGESNEPEDLIFSARESSIFSLKILLDIFLPRQRSSTDNHITRLGDFRVSGGYFTSSFKLFEPHDNILLAEVVQDFSWGGLMVGNYSFEVKIKPYVDVAFLIALLIITDDTSNFRRI